jgi:hypothetical protein
MRLRIRWLAGAIVALCVTGLATAQYGQTPAAPPRDVQRTLTAKSEGGAMRVASRRPAAQEPECIFTGARVVNSLARDDVDAAEKFVRFYERFSCPAGHLRAALRCVLEGGAPAPGKALSDRVDECWSRPAGASKGR